MKVFFLYFFLDCVMLECHLYNLKITYVFLYKKASALWFESYFRIS